LREIAGRCSLSGGGGVDKLRTKAAAVIEQVFGTDLGSILTQQHRLIEKRRERQHFGMRLKNFFFASKQLFYCVICYLCSFSV
jgi:hypothetical protein